MWEIDDNLRLLEYIDGLVVMASELLDIAPDETCRWARWPQGWPSWWFDRVSASGRSMLDAASVLAAMAGSGRVWAEGPPGLRRPIKDREGSPRLVGMSHRWPA